MISRYLPLIIQKLCILGLILVLIIFYKILPFFTYQSLVQLNHGLCFNFSGWRSLFWFSTHCPEIWNFEIWLKVMSAKSSFFIKAIDSPIGSPRILEEWITSWKDIEELKNYTESRRRREKVQGIFLKNRIKDILSTRFYTEESLNVVVSTKYPIISSYGVYNYSWHTAAKILVWLNLWSFGTIDTDHVSLCWLFLMVFHKRKNAQLLLQFLLTTILRWR